MFRAEVTSPGVVEPGTQPGQRSTVVQDFVSTTSGRSAFPSPQVVTHLGHSCARLFVYIISPRLRLRPLLYSADDFVGVSDGRRTAAWIRRRARAASSASALPEFPSGSPQKRRRPGTCRGILRGENDQVGSRERMLCSTGRSILILPLSATEAAHLRAKTSDTWERTIPSGVA